MTREEIINLRWMVRVNAEGVGLYGPTVRRLGPLRECAGLVENGLVELRTDGPRDEARGYFITELGRTALAAGEPAR